MTERFPEVGFFIACRSRDPTRYKAMLLVFNRTRSNGMIGNQILNIRKTCWIKQLIRSCQTSFCNHTVVEMSDRFQTVHKAWCCMYLVGTSSLYSHPRWSRFSRIDPHHNENLIFHLLLQVCQTTNSPSQLLHYQKSKARSQEGSVGLLL